MANANIKILATTANTFLDQMITVNNLSNTVNELRNGLTFYKDVGGFTIPNGAILLTATSGTSLSVTANALISGLATLNTVIVTGDVSAFGNLTMTGANSTLNVVGNCQLDTIYLDPTRTYQILNGNAVLNNLTVKGTQTTIGNTISTTDTLILRSTLATAGNGQIIIEQGTTNGNAELQFVSANGVWRTTANVGNGYTTLLTTANITDSVSSNSLINAGSANAIEWAYNTATTAYAQANAAYTAANSGASAANAYAKANASANTVATFANGTIVLAAANLNFNNTATVNVSAVANGSIQTNVSFVVNTSALGAGSALPTSGGTMTGNINCGVSTNVTVVNPLLAAYGEWISNTGTINNPNVYTANAQITNVFDITAGNTQHGSINVGFTGFRFANQATTLTFIIRQPGNSLNVANTVTWTNTIYWSNGEVPVLANLSGYADIITFITVDGGSTFFGAHSMSNCA